MQGLRAWPLDYGLAVKMEMERRSSGIFEACRESTAARKGGAVGSPKTVTGFTTAFDDVDSP